MNSAVVIKPDSRKGMAILTGRIGPDIFEVSREMPGRRRWQGRELLFELSRANIEFLQQAIPDAIWEVDRARVVERLAQLEADARAAKTRELPPEAFNFPFKTKPRDHQVKAFALSKDRVAFALLFEQGLGKTKSTLDRAAYLYSIGKIDTLLIDAPNGVHKQWIEEQIPIHLPEFTKAKCLTYKSEQTKTWLRQAEEVLAYEDGLRVIAIHHDAFATEKGVAFARRVLMSGKVFWVIDESSRKIKTPGAKRTKETFKLRDYSKYRQILDGTPVTKGAEDLFTQLRFLSDDVHGHTSFYSFRNRYCKVRQVPGAPTGVVEIYGYQNLEELQKRMDGWSLRMTSSECLDLPARTYFRRHIEMTPEQKRIYTEVKEDFLTQLDNGAIVTAEMAIVKIMRLQQILCGHVKDEEGVVHSIPTYKPEETLAAAEQSGDKVIVWARFHHDIDLLAKTFKHWNPVTWDGRSSTDERKAAKDKFIHDPSCGAFIANPGSAGIGTDGLQHASHTMLFYSNTFKASERWQAEARLFRDGQKGTVNVGDIIVPGTIEVKILSTLQMRKDIAFTTLDVRDWLTN